VEYENGYLNLEKKEVEFMSFMLMAEIKPRYEVNAFFVGVREVQASLIEEKNRYLSMNDRGAREEAAISLIEVTHDACEQLIALAQAVSIRAGKRIEPS
jgi:hypothetical protein